MQVSCCWNEALPLPQSLDILTELCRRLSPEGGTYGQKILALVESRDWKAVCDFELPLADEGWNVTHLVACRQMLAFFRKMEDLDIGIDKEQVAREKFEESEHSCRETNALFRAWLSGSVSLRPRDVVDLYHMRSKIKHVLGRLPDMGDLKMQFGPGATTTVKKPNACPQNKLKDGPVCSEGLLYSGLLPSVLREFPHWGSALESDWRLVPALDEHGIPLSSPEGDYWDLVEIAPVTLSNGKLEFVPKNAKTYRSIVVEPSLNGMLQSGIGSHIARRLKRVGVDLKDQSRQQRLAREGSITRALATLDLSSASDTVSRELVKFLLPEDWFTLLNAARSHCVTYRGHTVRLEKFSSMGNGFTFPLESLIFWAITCVADPDGPHGVFGDDMICSTNSVERVVHLLSLCGFSLNRSKSFIEGPFRESCGGDYYLGISTRPFNQEHLVSGATLFVLHNFWYRLGRYDLAEVVMKFIPRPIRIFGPDGYGDGHLLSEQWPRSRPKKLAEKGYGGVQFETYSLKGRRSVSRYPGDYISPLYSVYNRGLEPLGESLGFFDFPEEACKIAFLKDGRPVWTVPGSEGYSKVKIYTLSD